MAEKQEPVQGIVVEALPNTLFRVDLDSGDRLLCYIAGKMRHHRIRILVGDKVLVEIEPYGGKSKIVRRL
jgi:translation initiation factor IF-1